MKNKFNVLQGKSKLRCLHVVRGIIDFTGLFSRYRLVTYNEITIVHFLVEIWNGFEWERDITN